METLQRIEGFITILGEHPGHGDQKVHGRRGRGVSGVPQNKDTVEQVVNGQLGTFSEQEIIEAMDRFNALVKDSPICMRVDSDVLGKILDEGKFKNQLQTGSSNGYFDPDYRKSIERNAFGNNLKKPEDFPVYGYVDTSKAKGGFEPTVDWYGDAKVEFHEQVRKRTTVTWGDSLNGFEDKTLVGTPINNPQTPSMNYSINTIRNGGQTGYIEAQFHGGLTPKDIKSVHFTQSHPGPQLARKLAKLGIPYTVEGVFSDANGTLEVFTKAPPAPKKPKKSPMSKEAQQIIDGLRTASWT